MTTQSNLVLIFPSLYKIAQQSSKSVFAGRGNKTKVVLTKPQLENLFVEVIREYIRSEKDSTMFPTKGRSYSFRQIVKVLELRDTPFLQFDGVVIQTSHTTNDQELSVKNAQGESFADTMWRYLYETHEWIPIFEAVYPEHVRSFVDMKADWITLKGFPRENPEDEDVEEGGSLSPAGYL